MPSITSCKMNSRTVIKTWKIIHNYLFEALASFYKTIAQTTFHPSIQSTYCPYVKLRTILSESLYWCIHHPWHSPLAFLCFLSLPYGTSCRGQVFLICKFWWSLPLVGTPLFYFRLNCLAIVLWDCSPLSPFQPMIAGCSRVSFLFIFIVLLLSTWGIVAITKEWA